MKNDLPIVSTNLQLLLQDEISRRTVIVGLASLGAGAFLVGCGGSGGSGGGTSIGGAGGLQPVPTTSYKGQIVLPAGSNVKIAHVTNLLGVYTPSSTGAFAFKAGTQSKMLSIAYGTNGNPVLFGFLGPNSLQLSAQTTAVYLAYMALYLGATLDNIQGIFLNDFAGATAVANVAAAVSSSIISHGATWLNSNLDSGVVAALTALQSHYQAQASAGAHKIVHPAGSIVDPTAVVSGLQVTDDGLGSIYVTNNYRRRSLLYPARVSYRTKPSSPDQPYPDPSPAAPIMMAPVDGLTEIISATGVVLSGVNTTYYKPVTSDPIPAPVAPTTAYLTTYTITQVGLGDGMGDFGKLTDTQVSGFVRIAVQSALLDIVLPVIAGALLPLNAGSTEEFNKFAVSHQDVMADYLNGLIASDSITAKLKAGDTRNAIYDIIQYVLSSNTFKDGILQLLVAFVESQLPSVTEQAALTRLESLKTATTGLMNVLNGVNIGLTSADFAVIFTQIALSSTANVFTVQVTNANVKLNPLNPFIDWPNGQNLTISVIDADVTSDTVLSYNWSCAGNFGTIADASGHISSKSAISFDSSQQSVVYAPGTSGSHGLGGDFDIVTGVVYLGGINQRTGPVGQATAKVTYNAPIAPATSTVKADALVTLTASMSSTLPSGLQYHWSVSGGTGTVGGGAQVVTDTNSVVYTAGKSSGTATIALRVLDSSGNLFTQGSATVTVQGASILNPSSYAFTSPGQTLIVSVSGTYPTGTTYKWTTKSGTVNVAGTAQPYPKTLTTTVAQIYYNEPNPPADGSASSDILSVQVIGPTGAILDTGTAAMTYGGSPFFVANYPYTAANDKLIYGYVGTGLTNLLGYTSYLGLFYEFEDQSEGFFTIAISVPSGTFLAPGQSYPLSATNNITQLDVFVLGGAVVTQAPPIKTATLKIDSEINSPAGNGKYIGYSITIEYEDGQEGNAYGVVLQHS